MLIHPARPLIESISADRRSMFLAGVFLIAGLGCIQLRWATRPAAAR